MAKSTLSPKEKAAILIISLGKSYSAELYKHLSEDEINQLTVNITSTRRVESDVREQIINEFYEMFLAQKFIADGGFEYAKDVLEQAMGEQKAKEILSKIAPGLQDRPFQFVKKADPDQFINVILNEHPQTIALVLSYIDPKQAAEVFAAMPPEKCTDIIGRIANMGSTSPEYVREAERVLKKKITSLGSAERMNVGGIDSIVGIINSLSRTNEKAILDTLAQEDHELAEEIKNKLFVFEDIVSLPDASLQRVLKEVSNQDLATALLMATDDVSKAVFRNISKRLAEMIRDDMAVMGPVRVRDVEEAQQRIVAEIHRLDEEGEIVISRGEGDELVV